MGEEKRQSIPALPWMRDPVDVTLSQQLPLHSVPSLHPKYCTITLLHCYFCFSLCFFLFSFTIIYQVEVSVGGHGNLKPIPSASCSLA